MGDNRGVLGDLRVDRSVTIPASELAWRFSHSGGPGGQGVNTSDSKAELRFDLAATGSMPQHLKARALERLSDRLVDGAVVVTASHHRSQLDNRRAALTKLAMILAEAIAPAPPKRRPTRPSAAAMTRRIESKRRRGQLKRQRRDTTD